MSTSKNTKENILRLPAEKLFENELNALIKAEADPVPKGWKMSPKSVKTYICGGKAGNTVITPKYIGHERLVEIAIATLVTDRALLLIGEPGTARARRAPPRSRYATPGITRCLSQTGPPKRQC